MVVISPRLRQRRSARPFLVLGTLVALVAVLTFVGLRFIHPSDDGEMRRYVAGAVDDFPPGSVTTFHLKSKRDPALDVSRDFHSNVRSWSITLHIVRTDDGEIIAIDGRDPRTGCTVPWRPQQVFDDREGMFSDPCHGSKWDREGKRLFGPVRFDLYRFPVNIERNRVLVDVSRVIVGPPRITTTPQHLGP